MNSREIWGLVITILGLILIIVSLYTSLFILIYGIPIFVIGLIIMLNKNEDKIEKINYKGGKK